MTASDLAYVRYLRAKPQRMPMSATDRDYYALAAIRECSARGGHRMRKLYSTMNLHRCRQCGLEVIA